MSKFLEKSNAGNGMPPSGPQESVRDGTQQRHAEDRGLRVDGHVQFL